MYAIIETGGKQLWVIPGETVKVEKLEAKEGDKLTFNALWPQKAKVAATVVKQGRGEKIIVFKKRTKKAYKKTQGHRQWLTSIKIDGISLN